MSGENSEVSGAEGNGRDLVLARVLLAIVALGLLVSGLTCYFLPWEVKTATEVVWGGSPDKIPFMENEYKLLLKVDRGLDIITSEFPEFMLGTDWLGFAHVILAILFVGAMRDPVRNIWIVQFGMISAIMVVPAAWLFGYMRGLPAIHYFVDASFGVGAVIPLYFAYRIIRRLES